MWIAAFMVASWLAGFGLALLGPPFGGPRSASTAPLGPQVVAQLVFLILGLGVGIIGFVWARRTGHYVTRWRAVASPLNRQEKKSVRRQIAGKVEPDQRRLPIVLAIARQDQRSALGVAPLYSGIVLIGIGSAIATNSIFIKSLVLVSDLLFVAVAIVLAFAYRRAGIFIDSNSTGSSSETSGTRS